MHLPFFQAKVYTPDFYDLRKIPIFQSPKLMSMFVGTLTEEIAKPSRLNGGLHILSNFESAQLDLTLSFNPFKEFITEAVKKAHLSQVGQAWHNFEGGGFTGVLCLAESHLSIHTWPHNNYITFDIYLSNHSRDNSGKARLLYDQVLEFFSATVIQENSVQR
jgi:S-adenosylmethionine decarboxylase